ncbi:MAG: HAMP domain-containing sensor histidine kinase [Porticoccus sp.]|nr:HAMP domain-containing sensor histidine kinase [Porticoccus sp.]
MKMRISLRLYLFGTLMFLIVSLAALYFVLTIQYFIDGLDTATRRTMVEVVNSVDLADGEKTKMLDFHVVTRYDHVPSDIREQFTTPPEKVFELKKNIIQTSPFSRPKAAYFIMMVKTGNGEKRYVYRSITKNNYRPIERHHYFNPITYAMLVALTVIAVFIVLLLLIMRSVTHPVESLQNWAKSLSPDSLRKPVPKFRYSELNALAEIVRSSLLSVHQAMEREHDFLRHASHELRTPIATVRSNVELLKKLKPEREEKESNIVDRIERASATMNNLTETLLWLSRDEQSALPEEEIQLDQLIIHLVQELQYLLQSKPVKVHTQTQPYTIKLPKSATHIVLVNLIRNAFQHTQSGEIHLEQEGSRVSIINCNDAAASNNDNELGFGLGLDLTRKLTERFGWSYENTATTHGHTVDVLFNGKIDTQSHPAK